MNSSTLYLKVFVSPTLESRNPPQKGGPPALSCSVRPHYSALVSYFTSYRSRIEQSRFHISPHAWPHEINKFTSLYFSIVPHSIPSGGGSESQFENRYAISYCCSDFVGTLSYVYSFVSKSFAGGQ